MQIALDAGSNPAGGIFKIYHLGMIPMKNPRISVLIPTLNEGKYLEATLFHIRMQKPYEIIIGDSQSVDNTRRIAKKYGAKVATTKKRGSASYGRNAAAGIANGDVFVFIDADTIPYPNFLDVIRKDFSDKNLAGWTCNFFAFSPKFRDQVLFQLASNLIEALTKYARKPHAAGFAIAVRKDVFHRTGGFNILRAMEDHDFAMRVGRYGKFKFSNETCVFSSVRRLNKWGRFGLLKKYSEIYLKYFLKNKSVGKIRYEPVR